MAKKRKLSKKEKIELIISIFMIVIGTCFGLGVMYGVLQEWIGFAIYLSVTVVLSIIEIPLWYHGTTYECLNCGHKFKTNPYKVFLQMEF